MKTHQTYDPGATRTACGKEVQLDTHTARPGPKVTCKTCNRVESSRRTQIQTAAENPNK